jgi:glucokinase
MSEATTTYDTPRLIADVGGTFARFALEVAPGRFEQKASTRCADHADFHSAVNSYLTRQRYRVRDCAVAIANPVAGDEVRMTNYHWRFSIEEMRQRLRLDNLVVVNDFTALAMALPSLLPHQRRQVGGGDPVARSVLGLLGAGSGLGVSGLIPSGDDGWIALGTEGGHASFSPRNERELQILRYAWEHLPHVSFERLLSGPGMELIYRALADAAGVPDQGLNAPDITHRALVGHDPLCLDVIEAFCQILGTAAANLAVTQGALGGVYIGGGIVPRLGAHFDRSGFRSRFEDKGRFSEYLKAIPTYVITAEDTTFMGAAEILRAQLGGLEAAESATILHQIRRARPSLSPAEQRVADLVLRHPRSALNDPIAQLAKAAEVSQPTVIRFCRSLGCKGLSDFKLRLASGLSGTMPITHAQVTGADTTLEVGDKVLGNTASAILQVRDHLNRDSIDQAVRVVSEASRVEFYGVGHFGSVADDAQFKFLRLGMPAAAYTMPRLQVLAADMLQPGMVAVVISGSGRIDELLEVVDRAHARGALVVAITASQSPLARKADVALIVDHVEDSATHVPMISRILHLLMIDILVVGVSVRRGAAAPQLGNAATQALDEGRPEHPKQGARATSPGVSSAGALAHMTSPARSRS